jgi:RNA polymerase sigma-70 factor (ECF subfamily)
MTEFEEVYRDNVGSVFRFLYQKTGRRDVSEDLTGEVFLSLYQHWERLDKSDVVAWLFAVGKNLAIDYWRRNVVEQRYLDGITSMLAVDPQPPDGSLFENPSLKPVHRMCLILRYVHGMDRAEICQRTGLNDNQVKSYLQYARRLLRNQLADRPRRT